MFEKIYAELRAVPVTFIMLSFLYVIVGSLYRDHVSVGEMTAIRGELKGVRFILKRDHLDTRLASVQTDIFNVSQRINEDKLTARGANALDMQRLNALQSDEIDLHNRIAALNLGQQEGD